MSMLATIYDDVNLTPFNKIEEFYKNIYPIFNF